MPAPRRILRRAMAIIAGVCCAGFLLWLAFRLAEPFGLWDSRRGSGILGVLWATPVAAVSMIWPLWNLFDVTPEGRGERWYPQLAY